MEYYDEMEEQSVNEPSTDKFNEAFSKYNMKVDAAWVKSVVEKAKKEVLGTHDKETLKKIFSCIDLTTLKPTDNEDTVLAFVEKVNKMEDEYPDLPSVASICTWPLYAQTVSRSLEVESVKTCCVAGGFPSSQTFFEVKVAETSLALHDGADEIDIVQNAGHILNGDYETLADEIDELRSYLCLDHRDFGALGVPGGLLDHLIGKSRLFQFQPLLVYDEQCHRLLHGLNLFVRLFLPGLQALSYKIKCDQYTHQDDSNDKQYDCYTAQNKPSIYSISQSCSISTAVFRRFSLI